LPLNSAEDGREKALQSAKSATVEIDTSVFREMIDNSLHGIMVHHLHRPLYINKAWAELHGFTVAEIMARPTIFDLIHEADRKRLFKYAVGRLIKAELPERYRYRALHRSGRTIWLEQFVRLIEWKGQKAKLSTVIDIDDQERRTSELRRQRKMMEEQVEQRTEALTRSNQQLHIYRSIIDQVSERISIIDTNYHFRLVNRAKADHHKCAEEELTGRHIRMSTGDSWFHKSVKDVLNQCFRGETVHFERKVDGDNGEPSFAEYTCEPFRDQEGEISGAIISTRDVTAKKKTEQRLHLFASVVEQVSDRISVVGKDYCYRLTNKANLDYHKKPLDAFLGKPVSDILGQAEFELKSKPELDQCFAGESIRSRRAGRDGDGQEHMLDVLMAPYREEDGSISGAAITIRDVTEAQRLAERLAHQARYDQLTGLLNRGAFEHYLESAIVETSDNSQNIAFCFIDLDQFKVVNDTVGHLVGDQLLQDVAKLLADRLRDGDILARLGGDEFGLLLHGCSLRRAKRAVEHMIASLNAFQFFHGGLIFEVGASVGIAAINRHVQDVSDVMSQADIACYAAKEAGRNRVQIYKKQDSSLRQRHEEMYQAGGIRKALESQRFVLFAQPIAATHDLEAPSRQVEVLLRMQGPHGRLIPPSAFIPAAERYGLMAELDRWVIHETMSILANDSFAEIGTGVSINVSGVTLNDETSLDFIREVLTKSSIKPERISFEITETAAIRNIMKTQAFMEELREWGCQFALDDFGSGLSSLNYLKRLPVDYLKIDGSFVRDLTKDEGSHVMVMSIQQMANGLGIETVAEGVEDRRTLNSLKKLDIDYVQGFAIGKPAPIAKVLCGKRSCERLKSV